MDPKISPFLNPDGKIKQLPKKKAARLLVLQYLQGKFASDRDYAEKEVNEIIVAWHTFHDFALLRRELFDHFLINRTRDGRRYWIGEEKTTDDADGGENEEGRQPPDKR